MSDVALITGEEGKTDAPITFFRPIKRNVPNLRDKVDRLLISARSGDQVLFGVESEEDFAVCQKACDEGPVSVSARVVRCQKQSVPNPKIAKLMVLAPHAVHERWVVTDSEALLDPEFVDRFRAEWIETGATALTAGYRFTGATSWPQRLDHLPALLTLWPGLVVTDWATLHAPSGLGFTLGACTGVQRAALEDIGGWESLGNYLAEDHRLGSLLAAKEKPVRLSREILTLDADPMGRSGLTGWVDWLQHQHRVTVTYRACNPGGTFGMIFTHGVSWAILFVLLHLSSPLGWSLLGVTVAARLATAGMNARYLGFPATLLGILAASVAETGFWLVSWFPLPVRWGTRLLHLGKGGVITKIV